MSIRRNEPWGSAGALGKDDPIVHDDAELRALVEDCRRTRTPLPDVGVLGGDLCRTLGGRGDPGRLREQAARVTIDVVRVELDDTVHWFVAHLVAATATWSDVVLAMNAQWRGTWDVAPAAHPGDGLLDVVHAALPLGQRFEARRRLPMGTHLPHPGIEVRRVREVDLAWPRPRRLLLDGTSEGRARTARVRVEPAALTVVV